jgi:hypothetical protein
MRWFAIRVFPRTMVARLIASAGAVAMACFLIGFVVSRAPQAHADQRPSADQKTTALAERIASSAGISMEADNSEGPPISILSARVKAITGDEYRDLTGVAPEAEHFISFPEMQVSNNRGAMTSSFVIILTDKLSPDDHWYIVIHRNLAPNSQTALPSKTWVPVPREVRTTNSGIEDVTKSAWLSPKMWLPGAPEDFFVDIAGVDYTDGTSWQTAR